MSDCFDGASFHDFFFFVDYTCQRSIVSSLYGSSVYPEAISFFFHFEVVLIIISLRVLLMIFLFQLIALCRHGKAVDL